MAHNQRLNPDAVYQNGNVLGAAFWQALDTAQSKALNFATGGSWSPTSQIAFGGLGLAFASPFSTLSGGATIQTPFGSGQRIVLAADDTPELAPSHVLATRAIITSILASGRVMGVRRGFGGQGAVNVGQIQGPGAGTRILVPLRVHHGAILSSVSLQCTIAPHTGVPSVLPSWRCYAANVDGQIFPLNNTIPVVRSGGWLPFPAPISPSAYGGDHFFTYNVDGGGVLVDRVNYGFFVELSDERGANALPGNVYTYVRANHTGIVNMGIQ